jgi:hypothetical protein
MISVPGKSHIWLTAVDMRKDFDELAASVMTTSKLDLDHGVSGTLAGRTLSGASWQALWNHGLWLTGRSSLRIQKLATPAERALRILL